MNDTPDTPTIAHNKRTVRFVGVDPLHLTLGAVLPMIPDSWRYSFYEQDGELCFGFRDDGALVSHEAVMMVHEPVAQFLRTAEQERDHWKANHDQMVERLRLFTQRSDLPVDRLPAYQALVDAQEKLATLTANTPVSGSLDELLRHLARARVASCTCQTKTPEVAYHEKRCLYRILKEASTVIEGIPAYAAQQRDEGRAQYVREMQALWTDYKELAERYDAMLRDFAFRYSAGGYNSDGLIDPDTARAKLEWIVGEAFSHAKIAVRLNYKRYISIAVGALKQLADGDPAAEATQLALRTLVNLHAHAVPQATDDHE